MTDDKGCRCSIRHLYNLKELPPSQKDNLVSIAKNMERRRCNHHTLEEPLSTLECLKSVIDPKSSLTNKNRYVVASQDEEVRRFCRGVKGVPLVFVRRSVMIMEPMAESTVGAREGLERSKFRSGLRGRGAGLLGKRKRGAEDTEPHSERDNGANKTADGDQDDVKRKKVRGPKGPNPLAVRKPKKAVAAVESTAAGDQRLGSVAVKSKSEADVERSKLVMDPVQISPADIQNPPSKRKRKRKQKSRLVKNLAATVDGKDSEISK